MWSSTSTSRLEHQMKKPLRAAVMATLVTVGPLLLHGSSRATAAPISDRSSSSGNSAVVSAISSRPVSCSNGSTGEVFNQLLVIAREDVLRANGTRTMESVVDAHLSTFNTCDSQFRSAFGSTPPSVYDQTRTAATIQAAVPLVDVATGAPEALLLDFRLTSSGTPARSTSNSQFHFGSGFILFRSTGLFADATVSGSALVDGADLLQQPVSAIAQLGAQTNSEMTVTRRPRP